MRDMRRVFATRRVVGRHRVAAVHRVVAAHRVMASVGAVVALMLVGAGGAAIGILSPPAQVRTVSDTRTVSQTGIVRTGSIVRNNVGATHSPQLERMLAGHPGVAPRASARPAGLSTAASAVQGIDVSWFQHPISTQHPDGAPITWSSVAAAGYKFAFVKATEGSYYVNPWYAADIAGAQTAGMFAAPYAFAVPNYSGGALQADYMLDNADYVPDGRLLLPILDIEYDPYAGTAPGKDGTTGVCYGLSHAQMIAWIGAFTAEIQRRTGEHPLIYTTADWWKTCTGNSAAFSADPLWIANYDVSAPAMPPAWQNWIYWQYTSSATVSGISATNDVDTSWLSSTALELAAPANQSNRVSSQANLQVNLLYAGLAPTYTGPVASWTDSAPGTQLVAGPTPGTAVLSGPLPATPATFPVSITASVSGDPSATQTFSWYVHRKVSLANLTSQTASVGAPVRYQIRAKDGLSACHLQFSASDLPRGLTISSCGMISGWPLTSRTYTATVRATDSSQATVAQGSISWKVSRASGRGPAGHVVLARDGKCLTERSPTDIAIETCSGASAERWTVAADGSIRIGGKCLAAKSAKANASAALYLANCTGAQRWQVDSNAVLRSLTDGRCLADNGNKNGSRAIAAVCQATYNRTGSASTPSRNQQWTLPAGPLTSDIAGYCASTQRPAGGPSNAVTLHRCTTSATQDWTVEPDGALSAAGKCLRTATGTVSPGSVLRLVACARGAADQVWQLSGGPVGAQLVNPAAGLCLADPGDAATAGTTLRMEPCVAGDPGISWRVS